MSGPVMSINNWATNAELIADCARLGYLRPEWATLDPTYGYGTFWKTWRPETLIGTDLDPAKSQWGGSVDFTRLPWPEGYWDCVVFDPPYKLCLDTETEILTRRGWLTHDQVLIGDIAYSMNPATGLGEWKAVTGVHRYPAAPTQVAVCAGKNLDFVATPDHRWLVVTAAGQRRWKTTHALAAGDRVPHAAPRADAPREPKIEDAMVELVAWFWTEGTVGRGSNYGHITQSHVVNPDYCDRIAACFHSVYGAPAERFVRAGRRRSAPTWRVRDEERNRRFIFSAEIGSQLLEHAPNRVPTLAFLESLTPSQLELFIDVSVMADGNSAGLSQGDPERAHAFALACVLAGRPIATAHRPDGNGWVVVLKERPYSKPSRPGVQHQVRHVAVWCPTVADNETWLARRNGRIYFTGNSGTPALEEFDQRYGVHQPTRWQDRMELCRAGIRECARVLGDGYLLVKCQDQVVSGKIRWQTITFTETAEERGLGLVDRFDFLSYRPQPHGTSQKTARRCSSQLLVFKRGWSWRDQASTKEAVA